MSEVKAILFFVFAVIIVFLIYDISDKNKEPCKCPVGMSQSEIHNDSNLTKYKINGKYEEIIYWNNIGESK